MQVRRALRSRCAVLRSAAGTCVGLALCLVLTAGCGQMYSRKDLEARDARWEEGLSELREYQSDMEAENASLRARVAGLEVDVERARAGSAREASAEIERAFADLQKAMKGLAGYASGDLEYLDGPDGPVVRINDRILFPSGSHEVTGDGRALLMQLAAELARLDRPIRVVGHTDNVPVKVQAEVYPNGNLELSAARAVEAASVLIEGGFPAESLSVTGYGEWRPIESNATPGGRARNRRVEIAVLPARPQ